MIIRPDDKTEAGRAAAAIPGLPDVIEKLDELKAPLPGVAETPDDIRDATVADVLAGRTVDYTAAAERAAKAHDALRIAEGARTLRNHVRTQLEQRAEMLIEHGVDDALGALAESLVDLLAKADDAVEQLGPVRTAEDALRGTEAQHAAYATLDQLADRYAAIRRAQIRFTGTVWDQETLGTTLVAYGELQGRDQLWTTHTPTGRPSNTPPPWPHNPHPNRIGDGLMPSVETLIWLVTEERAEPWVPSIGQLHAEREATGQRNLQRQAEAAAEQKQAAISKGAA